MFLGLRSGSYHSEGGSRGNEWGGEEFYKELLLPYGGSLREGLVGHTGDGLS